MSIFKSIFIISFLGVILGTNSTVYAEDITVGTMDVIKNLNPYLAEAEIELALQKVAFPPLIADFIQKNGENEDSFRGILITNNNIQKHIRAEYLDFYLEGNAVTADVFIDNFSRIRRLGPKSKFSWNLDKAENLENGWVRAYFQGRFPLCKLIAASFPLVDFNSVTWRRSDQVFLINSELDSLRGFSNYRYDNIDHRSATVRLSPKKGNGKDLLVKSFPDYTQMIDRLNAGELQVAFNLSALTSNTNINPDIQLDDMKFANQYVLYMIVTDRGERKGLRDMRIINHIRKRYNGEFSLDDKLRTSGNIFLRNGFLVERMDLVDTTAAPRSSGQNIQLLYIKNTINDRIANIIEGIMKNMGYSFKAVAIDRNTAQQNIRKSDFDLVFESAYIQFPEFLNLRYYKNYIYPSSTFFNRYVRRINNLLTGSGTIDALEGEAQTLERELLGNFPIVFFLRYNTRIAVRKNTQKYKSPKGVPYFFYNLEKW